jgi:hypothetical protein
MIARITRFSRSRAFRAASLAARGAEKALAVPAPRKRLKRAAHLVSHENKFNHLVILRRRRIDRAAFPLENAALFLSAMRMACCCQA